MPRRARLYIPEHPYHLVQRGNNRDACFFEPDWIKGDGGIKFYRPQGRPIKEAWKRVASPFNPLLIEIATDAPPILKALNILPSIQLSQSRLRAIINKHQELPVDVIKDVPNYLADPLVIYEREFQGETNVLVEAKTKAGEPILVGIRNGELKTITPKNHSAHKTGTERLNEEIGRALVIYARNRKAQDSARASV